MVSPVPPARLRHRFAVDPAYRRQFAFAALGIFSLAGWASLVFGSQLFTVRDVVVAEGKGISAAEAKASVFQLLDQRPGWRPWPPRHRWFIDAETLAEQLKARWFAESVEVAVSPGSNIVRLIIRQQNRSFIVKTPGQFLRVNAQGVVEDELPAGERLPVLQRMAGRAAGPATEPIIEWPAAAESMAPGYHLPVSTDQLRSWFVLDQQVRKAGMDLAYVRVEPNRLVLFAQDGIPTYIDPSQNVLAQINAVQEFRRRAGKNGVEPATAFIDARVVGRLYVR